MNATQLANVLQKIKTDPVLQETLRVTKQDWVKLNLTPQQQTIVNYITNLPQDGLSSAEYIVLINSVAGS
jgi:hypothetical protein